MAAIWARGILLGGAEAEDPMKTHVLLIKGVGWGTMFACGKVRSTPPGLTTAQTTKLEHRQLSLWQEKARRFQSLQQNQLQVKGVGV